jgi:hypothetical protein
VNDRNHETRIWKIHYREQLDSEGKAYLKDNGDLVIAGYDWGKDVEKLQGDWDYEYWHTVKAKAVPSEFMSWR